MKFFIFLFVFFSLGFLLIISNHNLAMCRPENVEVFFDLVGNWVGQVYLNLQVITGNIIEQTWLPK
jgi:hypothetical protein